MYFSKLYKKTADVNSIIDAMDLNDERKKYYKNQKTIRKSLESEFIEMMKNSGVVTLSTLMRI